MISFDDKNTLQYISSGQFTSENEWIHPERICDSNEIIFVQNGTVYIAEEDNEYVLRKNDILILEKNRRHYGYKKSSDVSFFWIHFLCSDFEKLPKLICPDMPLSLVTLFSQVLHFTNTPGYSQNCGDMLCGLILEEILFLSTPVSSHVRQLAVSVKEWVRINSDKAITTKDVSDKFGYTSDHINRIFKQSYGIALKQYIIDTKLEKAKLLLQTTLYTTKQIGCMIGFEDKNLFIKFFKYHTKMPPTAYRNIYTNTHKNKN